MRTAKYFLVSIIFVLLTISIFAQQDRDLSSDPVENNSAEVNSELSDLQKYFKGEPSQNISDSKIIIYPSGEINFLSTTTEQARHSGVHNLGPLERIFILVGIIVVMIAVLIFLWRRKSKQSSSVDTYIDKHPRYRT